MLATISRCFPPSASQTKKKGRNRIKPASSEPYHLLTYANLAALESIQFHVVTAFCS